MNKDIEKLIKDYEPRRLDNAFGEFNDEEVGMLWFSLALAKKAISDKDDAKLVKKMLKAIVKENTKRS
jgi:hypothetical protein